jgi:hypothetical protein
LVEIAVANQVQDSYISSAKQLTSQMAGNIAAREILDMFEQYPKREYPEPEDPNDKGKTKDKKPPAKKKKKKEPAFAMPEWATELQVVIDKMKEIEKLVQDRVNLNLDDEFCAAVAEQLARFKKEFVFRRQQEE